MAAPHAFRSVAFSCATLLASLLASLTAYAAAPVVLPLEIRDPSNVCAQWVYGGTVQAPTLTCVAATVSGAPTGCVAAATPSGTVAASGGSVTLGVSNCSPSDAVPGPWTTSSAGASIVNSTMSIQANTGAQRNLYANIQMCSPTDATACASFTATVTQAGGSTAPPPTGFPTSCVGPWGNTLSTVLFSGSDMAFDSSTQYSAAGLSGSDVVIGRFRTGPNSSQNISSPFGPADIAVGAYKKLWISASPCDFANALVKVGPGQSPQARVTVGANPLVLASRTTYYPNLAPNTTYFVMVTMEDNSGPNCSSGTCGITFIGKLPSGNY